MTQLTDLLHASWREQADKIASVDEQLNTDGGSGALARDAIAQLPEERVEQITTLVTNLVDAKDAELLAVDALIRRVLRKVAGQVKTYVEANKTEATELAADVVVELRSQRKAAVEAANALRLAAGASEPALKENENAGLNELFPEFSNLRGAGPGTRTPSPRFKGSYAWAVDGKPITGDKTSDVAKKIGMSNVEFKNGMNAYWQATYNGTEFPFGEPPASFEIEIVTGDVEDPDGHQVYRIAAEQRSSDDDDTEDEEAFEEDETDDDIFES